MNSRRNLLPNLSKARVFMQVNRSHLWSLIKLYKLKAWICFFTSCCNIGNFHIHPVIKPTALDVSLGCGVQKLGRKTLCCVYGCKLVFTNQRMHSNKTFLKNLLASYQIELKVIDSNHMFRIPLFGLFKTSLVNGAHMKMIHLAFYLSVDYPGVTFLQGIGRRYSHVVIKKADVDLTKRAGELTDEEVCKQSLIKYA